MRRDYGIHRGAITIGEKRSRISAIVILALAGIAAAVLVSGPASAAEAPAPVVKANANGEIQMLSPYQKIHFNIATKNVEYWNYDYPEGAGTLHYQSTITCSFIDKVSKEARFMLQIPAGHPGLSGLYVVAYVKIVDASTKNYLYGHSASSDLATATTWCQTGAGFGPGLYHVKSGVLYIK